jgi:hypothetical protein
LRRLLPATVCEVSAITTVAKWPLLIVSDQLNDTD